VALCDVGRSAIVASYFRLDSNPNRREMNDKNVSMQWELDGTMQV
jgi:hypothetical protein